MTFYTYTLGVSILYICINDTVIVYSVKICSSVVARAKLTV